MLLLKLRLRDVVLEKPKMIYYSACTPWWTHRVSDLGRGDVPLDKYGSPLFETDKVDDFLSAKRIRECGQYGNYPIGTFMITHNDNIEILEKYVSKVNDMPNWVELGGMEGISKLVEKLIDKRY